MVWERKKETSITVTVIQARTQVLLNEPEEA
jgi:hypothetical protein